MKKARSPTWQFPLLSGTQQTAVWHHTSNLQKFCAAWQFHWTHQWLTDVFGRMAKCEFLAPPHACCLLMNRRFKLQDVRGNYPDPTAMAFEHLIILMAFAFPMFPEIEEKREKNLTRGLKFNQNQHIPSRSPSGLLTSCFLNWTILHTNTNLLPILSPCMADFAEKSRSEMLWRQSSFFLCSGNVMQ